MQHDGSLLFLYALSPVSLLTQTHPVHNRQYNFFKIHFSNSLLPATIVFYVFFNIYRTKHRVISHLVAVFDTTLKVLFWTTYFPSFITSYGVSAVLQNLWFYFNEEISDFRFCCRRFSPTYFKRIFWEFLSWSAKECRTLSLSDQSLVGRCWRCRPGEWGVEVQRGGFGEKCNV